MKFGKTYAETLASPSIPQEWRQTAVEYRKLKKVINRIASELEALGLTSEVLRDLLEKRPESPDSPRNGGGGGGKDGEAQLQEVSSSEVADIVASSSFSLPSADSSKNNNVKSDFRSVKSGMTNGDNNLADSDDEGVSENVRGKRKVVRKRHARASYELSGTSENPEPRIHLIFSSASSDSLSMSSDTDNAHPFLQHQSSEDTEPSSKSGQSSDNPNRFVELPSSGEEESATGDSSKSEDDDFEGKGTTAKENDLLKKMYGHSSLGSQHSDDGHDWRTVGVDVDPHSTTTNTTSSSFSRINLPRRSSSETLREQDGDGNTPVKRDKENVEYTRQHESDRNDVGYGGDDESAKSVPVRGRRHVHRQHRKEVFIPLKSDTEFLTLLAQALASLAALQIAQKKNFTQQVKLLATEVSQVSSPSRPKSDLYVWREIFSLWVEAQIFESDRERDRGERSVEEVEKKLDWFVEQVAKRKLAKRMRHKESRSALEKFIKLNADLLDMKKFQMANEEAARKILKKHDKRTALTAAHGFPQFIAAASSLSPSDLSQEARSNNDTSRVLILPGFPSLPHILLSTFTSALLPIIPQLEDYECAICGEVAFKPIRLQCGHKFCVRCLVKMQKRGQDACPQCRSPVVLRANASNLDEAMSQYLKLWFPKEVKAKDASNRAEAAKEQLEEMGLVDHKCLLM